MKISEIALLKIMHQRISPNAPCLEHFSKAFFALCLNEQANSSDVRRLTELDEKCAQYVLEKLSDAGIVTRYENEFLINISPDKIFELIIESEPKISEEKTVDVAPLKKQLIQPIRIPQPRTIPQLAYAMARN